MTFRLNCLNDHLSVLLLFTHNLYNSTWYVNTIMFLYKYSTINKLIFRDLLTLLWYLMSTKNVIRISSFVVITILEMYISLIPSDAFVMILVLK